MILVIMLKVTQSKKYILQLQQQGVKNEDGEWQSVLSEQLARSQQQVQEKFCLPHRCVLLLSETSVVLEKELQQTGLG